MGTDSHSLDLSYNQREEQGQGREVHVGLTNHPGSLSLLVFEIDADIPYYRVENNRIIPQLADKKITDISKTRYTAETQGIVAKILAETPDFKQLCDQLEVQGQNEPCIITYDGELVDGAYSGTYTLRVVKYEKVDVGVEESGPPDDGFDPAEEMMSMIILATILSLPSYRLVLV